MPQLVAIDLPGDHNFVVTLLQIWDSGDAAFVLDQRLPQAAKVQILNTIGAHFIVDDKGRATLNTKHPPMQADDALVLGTSGTSGQPKGVVHTHSSLAAASVATNDALHGVDSVHWLACLPLSHIGGFGVVARALYANTPLTLHPNFNADQVMRSVPDGVTHVSLVATALRRVDPALFKVVLIGGSAAPTHLPKNVITTYGLTESCGGVVYDGSPLKGVGLRIADNGEIQIFGDMTMRAYRSMHAIALHPFTEDGWLKTGDLGVISLEGKLSVSGRSGDLIISGGENIWPAAVEAALLSHPGVSQVCVAGIADPQWGQKVVAWVVRDHEHPVTSLSEFREFVGEVLPRYCAPKEIIVVDELPTTTLGKVQRNVLVANYPS